MTSLLKNGSLFLLIVFFLACGGATGGSEFGNPDRAITGTLVEGSSTLLKVTTTSCPADTAEATDSLGAKSTASVESNCSFRLPLATGNGYMISFSLNDQFVALLTVDNGIATFNSSTVFLSIGDTDVDLGTITIVGGVATPSNQPSEQSDRDGDGIDDFDDSDDDNDGISDEDEEDCDLDGFIDDDDEDEAECEDGSSGGGGGSGGGSGSSAIILEVEPDNNQNFVSLNDEVEARFSCDIDPATVTASTFTVTSDSDSISCNFEVSNDEVDCEHGDDDFQSNTNYTATINGVKCEDGTSITTQSWSWTTRD